MTGLRAGVQPGLYRTLLTRLGNPMLAVSADQGARPIVHAATAPDVEGGQFIGPTGVAQMRGTPGPVPLAPHATDQALGRPLWTVSGELTGVRG